MATPVDNPEKMRRVAELYVGIGSILIDTMCFKRIVSMELDDDKGFDVKATPCTMPRRDQPLCDSTISAHWMLTFASMLQCQTVTAWNLAWLLYLTESKYLKSLTRSLLTISAGQDLYIKEVVFTNVKPCHKYVCHHVNSGDSFHSDDFDHRVISISSTDNNDELVSDPSYAQYSFNQGFEDIDDCMRTRLHGDSSPIYEKLGLSVKRLRTKEFFPGQYAIISQLVNKIVFEEVERLEGADSFLGLGTREFQDARDRIFARVKAELESLRTQLDTLIYPVVNKAELEILKEQYESQGNKECCASYERQVETTYSLELSTSEG